MKKHLPNLLLTLAALTHAIKAAPPTPQQTISYNFHVRPILSDKCFFCHGPDEKNNKAQLRLDTAEHAYAALKESDGHAIVPHSPHKSQLLTRILSSDPDKIMPPPESKLKLTEQEIQTLKTWINQGAKYEPHWAFTPLPKSTPVPITNSPWPTNPIDNFILQKLNKQNIQPSPPAADWQWLRRVTLDLTGLPPTPTEIQLFLKNNNHEAVVDRLLASPAYGERMATPWLDSARYADSYGYQSDQLNVAWPYRDWVIRAFNKNLPYDQFITQNLAGDLLPNPTKDQILATAYNRIHRLTNEGGSIPAEFLAENAGDRLHTMGTAMLGLTMECARCHDHKYDPITQRDYFSMTAFFNSIGENGLYDHPAKIPSPSILLPTPTQEKTIKNTLAKIHHLQQKTQNLKTSREPAFQAWLNSPSTPTHSPDLIAHFPLDPEKNNHLPNIAPNAKSNANRNNQKPVPGKIGTAIQLDGDNGITIPNFYPSDRWDTNTHSLWIFDQLKDKNPVVILQKTQGTDVGYNGYDLMLENGHLSARWYRVWPGNAIGIRTINPIPQNQWNLITWTYDGSSTAHGINIFINGKPAPTKIIANTKMLKSVGVRTSGSGHYTIGQRFRDRGFAQGKVDDLRIHNRVLTNLEIQDTFDHSALQDAIKNPSDNLREYYLSAIDPVLRTHQENLRKARQAHTKAQEQTLEIAIMRETPTPTPTHLLERGEYDQPRELVPRAVPHFLPQLPANAPKNRLTLAQWMTTPDHPLTSRVYINRIWQQFFGTGIVKSVENFGIQGQIPSHPQLLNWLARDFINNGWDTKKLCKKIVLSSTYRQASKSSKKLSEIDPENRLLARGPAYRLDAEIIRDTALASSGLLKTKIGGPPVAPYQPGGDLWRESNSMSPAFKRGTGDALHRRSLYTVWKRTAPYPNMLAFDATPREVCTVTRTRTNTPLQALVLLNDTQFIETSRTLAEKNLTPQGINIPKTFLTLTGRPPSTPENKLLTTLYQDQLKHYQTHPEETKKLLSIGDTKITSFTPELAAATILVQTIFNLDATIWKR